MKHVLCFALGLSGAIAPAWAEDAPTPDSQSEIIVTASRGSSGVSAELYAGSATLFSAAELGSRQTRAVSDILRDAPGVSVGRAGGPGALTAVRIRGGEANHTLVLIDGVEAGDPFQGEFDFGALIADDVARVELLRGAQSALYGSDAVSGVVHYITLSGAEAPGVSGRLEAGSLAALDGAARAAGVWGGLDYAVSGALSQSDGVSIARSGAEADAALSRALSGRFAYDASEALRFRAVARYASTRADTDPQPGPLVVDDAEPFFRQIARYGLLGADLALLDGRWTQSLDLQTADVDRRNYDAFPFFTEGRRDKASYVTALALSATDWSHRMTFAADWERETYRNVPPGAPSALNDKRTLATKGAVFAYEGAWRGKLGVSAAARFDSNDRFDDAATWRAGASYVFAHGLKLHAAAGTGVKNPTNFELFGYDPSSFIGNPALKPERSRSWEIGAAQRFGAARASLTYFNAELEDEIFVAFGGPPDYASTPDNRATASEQQGVELAVAAELGAGFSLDGAYTWLDAQENGVAEIRRPEQSGSVNLAWRDASGKAAFLTVRYNGEMQDDVFTFPVSRTRLRAYTLVNAGGEMRLNGSAVLYARVENALDETYEDVFSYAAPGRTAYLGVRAAF